MIFRDVAADLAKLPLFETGLLYAGADRPQEVQRQLADWARAGKVVRLRRGLYTVAPPYRSEQPHSYLIANHLVRGSYVSLHSALAHFDLIPEHVAVVTSITTGRPGRWQNPYGHFSYQHVQPAMFFGFCYRQLSQKQWGYLATPEKALLDLVYLTPDADHEAYIRGLRLQNLDQLDLCRLSAYVELAGKPKLRRAQKHIVKLVMQESSDYVLL
jgi:predicted transcriptional regulator of viral defense system